MLYFICGASFAFADSAIPGQKGISVYEAREIRPSLEDVFVKVTELRRPS